MAEFRWYKYLWLALLVSLVLPFYDVGLVWLSLFFMAAPVVLTLFLNDKTYCNHYCGRAQLYQLLGTKYKLSSGFRPPKFLRARWFRIAFLVLFVVRFGWMMHAAFAEGMAARSMQWAMLATTALGMMAMLLFRPRTWCVVCPMGTLTQEMCKLRNK